MARRTRTPPPQPLEPHPAAAVWPMLPDDELAALARSISEVGLLEPIVLTPDRLVLDGRNRLAACALAGVEPTFTTYDGDPVAFVLARNEHRRHMSKGQRAMAAWMTAATSITDLSQRQVALDAGVSQPMVSWASTVAEHAPDLVPQVIAGTVALKAAHDSVGVVQDRKAERQRQADALAAKSADLAAKAQALLDGLDTITVTPPKARPDLEWEERLQQQGLIDATTEAFPEPGPARPKEWDRVLTEASDMEALARRLTTSIGSMPQPSHAPFVALGVTASRRAAALLIDAVSAWADAVNQADVPTESNVRRIR